MKCTFVAAVVVLMAAAAGGRAQEVKGIRAELIVLTGYAQEKILLLENAIPEEKMTWRPSAEVRSISEVYSHIAYGNYLIGRIAGMALPDGLNLPPPEERDKWEKAATDKKAIRDQLVKSFEFVKKGIASMPDSSLEKMVDFFGPQVSARTVLMILLTHVHEHLGQSIAYARTAGVVPPWAGAEGGVEKGKK
jgi:uncharacterized damage-inducible protein DinB